MSVQEKARELAQHLAQMASNHRPAMVAISGPPAAGKSTISDPLKAALADLGLKAVVVPMDGFHLDNRILDECGDRARKGAAHTFDAGGFVSFVRRIKTDGNGYYPVFDRDRDIAIAGAGEVTPECDIVLFEGNYLLLEQDPWTDLKALWDYTIFVQVDIEVVRQRCIDRWLAHDHTLEDAIARSEANDVRNAKVVLEQSWTADLTVDNNG